MSKNDKLVTVKVTELGLAETVAYAWAAARSAEAYSESEFASLEVYHRLLLLVPDVEGWGEQYDEPEGCGFLCGCEKHIEAANDNWAWEQQQHEPDWAR